MSQAARSLYVFGVYLIVAGAGFLLVPNLVLASMGVPPTTEVWIRVLGLLVAIVGIYYNVAARSVATPFFVASVWVRAAVLPVMIALIVLGRGPLALIGFGIADALGALWTGLALRAERA
jgi:hypothetical protein